jgi:hypothetical protein
VRANKNVDVIVGSDSTCYKVKIFLWFKKLLKPDFICLEGDIYYDSTKKQTANVNLVCSRLDLRTVVGDSVASVSFRDKQLRSSGFFARLYPKKPTWKFVLVGGDI